jgi:hypothetical protein
MASMHSSRITEIWRWLDLPFLAEDIVAGVIAARDPAATLLSCPHNHHPNWHDRVTRKCRVAWRVAFREAREKGCVPLITMKERRAA